MVSIHMFYSYEKNTINSFSKILYDQQFEVIIGIIGPVTTGKTTLIDTLSQIYSKRSKFELTRNISIKLGFARCSIKKYITYRFNNTSKAIITCSTLEKSKYTNVVDIIKLNYLDCPGHEKLLSTILSGMSVMKNCILMLSSETNINRIKTIEYFVLLKSFNIKEIPIILSKIDLSSNKAVFMKYMILKSFIENSAINSNMIFPFTKKANGIIATFSKQLVFNINTQQSCTMHKSLLFVIRTFSINKSKTKGVSSHRSVFGGSLLNGQMKLGQLVELKPGFCFKNIKAYKPIIMQIQSLVNFDTVNKRIIPNKLIALGTSLDIDMTKNDNLVGSIIGDIGTIPALSNIIKIKYQTILRCIRDNLSNLHPVIPNMFGMSSREVVLVHLYGACLVGIILSINELEMIIELKNPYSVKKYTNVIVSKLYKKTWKIIVEGLLIDSKQLKTV